MALGTFADQAEQIVRRLKVFESQTVTVLERFGPNPAEIAWDPVERVRIDVGTPHAASL